LRLATRNSPSVTLDCEWAAEVDGILAGLSADELATVYASIDLYRGGYPLAQKVAILWAAKDPAAALTAANAATPGKSDRIRSYNDALIFKGWAMDHPADARAWLQSPDFPASLARYRDGFQISLLTSLLDQDEDQAKEEFSKASPAQAAETLREWAQADAADPSMRDKLVELTTASGRPQDRATLDAALVSSWKDGDANGLRAYLDSDAIPETSRPTVDAVAVAALIERGDTPEAALDWWTARHADATLLPPDLHKPLARLAEQDPGVALAWLARQPDNPQRDALYAAAIPALVSSTAEGHFSEGAQAVAAIHDPQLQRQAAQRLDYFWTNVDPEAAAEWRKSRPSPGK
jgi:hypothetical protein